MQANPPGDSHMSSVSASGRDNSFVTRSACESAIERKSCMNCGGGDLRLIIDLGRQPNGNSFIDETQVGNEPTYSMRMVACTHCWQVQIDEFPSQEVLFHDHPYVSGVNVPV